MSEFDRCNWLKIDRDALAARVVRLEEERDAARSHLADSLAGAVKAAERIQALESARDDLAARVVELGKHVDEVQSENVRIRDLRYADEKKIARLNYLETEVQAVTRERATLAKEKAELTAAMGRNVEKTDQLRGERIIDRENALRDEGIIRALREIALAAVGVKP